MNKGVNTKEKTKVTNRTAKINEEKKDWKDTITKA